MNFVSTHFCNDLRLNWTLRNTSSSLPFFKAISNKYKVFCKKNSPHYMISVFLAYKKLLRCRLITRFLRHRQTPHYHKCAHTSIEDVSIGLDAVGNVL